MSQQQPRRPQADEDQPIKYGDVFQVSGDLADQPVKPHDAAMMQSAENLTMGQTQRGGPAAVMQSAAALNERAGLVGHREIGDIPGDQGVSVTQTDFPGARVVTESVGGQVVGQYTMPAPVPTTTPAGALDRDAITIGEALEATARTAGAKRVEKSDAAAIQAAEARATGLNENLPGGVAAAAQSAAEVNPRIMRDAYKTTLGDVLTGASAKLPTDKPATREDAERVAGAEMRNDPPLTTHPVGVAASVAAAARLNQNREI